MTDKGYSIFDHAQLGHHPEPETKKQRQTPEQAAAKKKRAKGWAVKCGLGLKPGQPAWWLK